MQAVNGLSNAKRALLDEYLHGRVSTSNEIHRRSNRSSAPLSAAQEQLYLRERQLGGQPPLYNECVTIRMSGLVHADLLERSFNDIVRRHDAWRSTFEVGSGDPVQVIHPAEPVRFARCDLSDLPEEQREAEALRLVSEDARRPFQLDRLPLLRPSLMKMSEDEHRLFLVAHQLILDGRSAYQIYPSELAALYKAYLAGAASPLPDLPVQYADFAGWQRHWLADNRDREVAYWRKQLDGLAAERAARKPNQYSGRIWPFTLSPAVSEKIRRASRELNTTIFLVLLTGLTTLIHRETGRDDVVLGTLSPAGRKWTEVMDLLGYFLNPVALRIRCREDEPFADGLRSARAVLSEAISNDDVPIEDLALTLRGDDSCSPGPFFRIAVSLQPPTPDLGLPWSVTSMDVGNGGSPWPLYLAFIDTPDRIIGRAQFQSASLELATVQRLLEDLQGVLEAMDLRE